MAKHVAILGAGISGLATAWFLKQALGSSIKVTLIEKSHRTGGWIESINHQDFLFELGPRSCRTKASGRETLQLIEALGLQDQIIGADSAARSRFLYYQGKLQPLPRHPLAMPFNPLMKGWLKALKRDWSAPKSNEADESLYSFFSRRLGPAWCERLIDPFISGIYAGDMRKLSIKSCFPLLWQWEHRKGSLLKGAWSQSKAPPLSSPFVSQWEKASLFSLKQGMEGLTRALTQQVEAAIYLASQPKAVSFGPDFVSIQLADGRQVEADHLIAALPASSLASLLMPADEKIAALLNGIPYATVMVVNLGYRKKMIKQQGFGYLVPFQEQEEILGCVWGSCVFPQQNTQADQTRLTVMIGGTRHPQIKNYSEKEGLAIALSAVHRHLQIEDEPEAFHVKLASQAIPQYEVGHQKLVEYVFRELAPFPRLTLTGNTFYGVSVNDCVAQARQLAQQLSTVL